ncbi:hypothetical protein C0584_02805 [Candidatus Parcubacteria bacterium]|nr:MAG: hypothetical protein C0584_02805 [Candidatus Parcubacteria bacterium]
MRLIEITNKEVLDNFLSNKEHSEFLQSWSWGEFQKNNGENVKRLAIEEEEKIVAVFTLIKKRIGLGLFYYYSPRGPILADSSNKEASDFLITEIEKMAKKDNAVFFRFETKESDFSLYNPRKTIDLQPQKTLVIDLKKSEDELLAEMHQKTRYNIRLAKKKGVEISRGSFENFDHFWNLMSDTSRRDSFRVHSRKHYENLLKLDFIELYFAKFENNFIAAGIFSFFGDAVTYLHGASSNKFRNTMSPFLLQWYLICVGKEKDYKFYDFYGIDEQKWPGVTRFKKGFGGEEIEYAGTLDIPFRTVCYNMYKFFRYIRRKF